ncbi:unnamed protein product [Ophioblennius macclurei]
MCTLLPAWLCLLLGLLPMEIQSRALSVQRAQRHNRLNLPKMAKYPVENTVSQEDRHIIWRALLHKEPPQKPSDLLLDGGNNALPAAAVPAWTRGSRGRRHASSSGGRGHSHLMRVGCVLGTCQVQNLSHRLYQLIGQSGREDSSPINPRSPHSYG